MRRYTRPMAVALLLAISACGTKAPLRVPDYWSTVPSVVKSYSLGEPSSAYAGETMLSVKTGYPIPDVATTDRAFALKQVLGGLTASAGVEYPVLGKVTFQDRTYRVVGITPYGGVKGIFTAGALVDEDGIVQPHIYLYRSGDSDRGGIPSESYDLVPPSARMEIQKNRVSSMSGSGPENYELVFLGKRDGDIHILYREYDRPDMEPRAVTRDLAYRDDGGPIRLGALVITVDQADEQMIRYTVVSD